MLGGCLLVLWLLLMVGVTGLLVLGLALEYPWLLGASVALAILWRLAARHRD